MLKLKLQYFGHLMQRVDSLEKTLMLGKIEGRKRREQEDEMVGWHHRLNGHKFEQTPAESEGQPGVLFLGSQSWTRLSNWLAAASKELCDLGQDNLCLSFQMWARFFGSFT